MTLLKNKYFLLSSLSIVLVSLSNVFFSFSIKYLIDALTLRDVVLFQGLLGVLLLAMLVLLVSEYAQQQLSQHFVLKESEILHERKTAEIYSKRPDQVGAEDLSVLTNDLDQVKELYLEPQLTLVQGLASLIISLFALLALDFWTALLVFALSCLPILIPFLFEKKLTQLQEVVSDQQAQHLQGATDFVQGIRVIKNSLSGQQFKSKLNQRYQFISQAFLLKNRWRSLGNILIGASFYGTTLSILALGGWQVLQGQQTVGSILAIYALSTELVHPISLIASALSDRKSSRSLLEKFPQVNLTTLEKVEQATDFDQFSLRALPFPTEKGQVLTFPDLVIKKGEKILLRGANGTGKTTLLELLTKNKPVPRGHISLNGRDINDLSDSFVQQLVSYLPQKAYLFHDSLLNNLTLYQAVDDRELMGLIDLVGLSDRFPSLASLSEMVKEEGQLSGGQVQKLALVRSLLQHRPILFLDEGLNAMDTASYQRLETYLLEQEDLTLIHISHQAEAEPYDKVIELS